LAAVAVPAYSGYIEKAEKAGDLQLLGAINTAFASACLDNSFSQYDVKGAMIPIDENGKIGSGSFTASETVYPPKYIASLVFTDNTGMTNAELVALNNAFALFFSGNETASFEVIKGGLFYSPTEGGFVAMEDYAGDVTVSYKGSAFTVNAEDIQKLSGSSYAKIGAEDLLGKVDFAAGLCAGLVGNDTSALYSLVNSAGYRKDTASAMGFENVGEYMTYLSTLEPAAKNEFLANSLVLSAAQNSSATINESILTNLAAGKINTNINSVDAIAETAAVYALYTAYAQDKGLSTDGITGNSTLNKELASEDFMKYAASDAAKADLEAYLSAMNVVNDATSGNATGTKDVLTNGFSDAELAELLGSMMG